MVLFNKVLIPLTVAAVCLPAVAQTGSPQQMPTDTSASSGTKPQTNSNEMNNRKRTGRNTTRPDATGNLGPATGDMGPSTTTGTGTGGGATGTNSNSTTDSTNQ